MKKIKSRDAKIPKTAEFACNNCNTRFESNEFEIDSTEVTVRQEKLPIFTKYNRVWWTKSVYVLSADCPVCDNIVSIEVDRGLPEKRNELLAKDAWVG